jgi:o-succinylbenzoate synthase
MALKATYYKHTLNFRFEAGTSRGVLKNKDSWFIKLWDSDSPQTYGLGEAGPLRGLSPDFHDVENQLKSICQTINDGIEDKQSIFHKIKNYISVQFAFETAFNDLENGGNRMIYKNDFYAGKLKIPINGLVWMGDKSFMKNQISEKIYKGYNTIKLKIGAIDFDEELDLLAFIRSQFNKIDLEIRVDANGAFEPELALEKLKRLSEFDIHSIEQPIKPGQWEEMAHLCEKSPISIALDEEIIGHNPLNMDLLKTIKPQYIILKPSLLGGLEASQKWVKNAENEGIGWWLTSALESNVGLNAIAQFCAELKTKLPQGLGTGQLYFNNFDSPLTILNGFLYYDKEGVWNLNYFEK